MTAPVDPGCPECTGRADRQGTKTRRTFDIGADGMPEFGTTRVQRWRCSDCATYFTTGFAASGASRISSMAARDAVANDCFEAGYAATASRYGINEKTARAMWREWASLRESEVPDRLPGFIGVHPVAAAGRCRLVVTDVLATTVVDVLPDDTEAGIESWLDRMDGTADVETVSIGFHAPSRGTIGRRLPHARVTVCPDHAAAAGLVVFLAAFGSMRRSLGRGTVRNVAEAPRTFATRLHTQSTFQADELSAWDDRLLHLYRIKEAFMSCLAGSRSDHAAKQLDGIRSACMGLPGASVPAMFIVTWGGHIADGIGEPALRPFQDALSGLQEAWTRRRPGLPFELARGLAVLLDGPREQGSAARAGATPSNLGVAMDIVQAEFARTALPAGLPRSLAVKDARVEV